MVKSATLPCLKFEPLTFSTLSLHSSFRPKSLLRACQLEVESWTLVPDSVPSHPSKAYGGLKTLKVEEVLAMHRSASGRPLFEVKWKEKNGRRKENSVLSLKQLAESQPKVVIDYLVERLALKDGESKVG
jgi:hypothetical protein